MRRLLLLVLLATSLIAQDVYVPPVPIGIARDGKVRKVRTPIAFPGEETRWIRVRSEHYDVISSASEERTRAIVGDLETLASVLTKVSTRFRSGNTATTVLVFANRAESVPYFELLLDRSRPAATGMYVRHEDGGTMFIDAARTRAPIERTAMHELVHDLLRQSEEVPPLWIEEGLAEYFANAEIRDGEVTAGHPIRAHASLLRRRLAMPLAQMFAVQPETDVALTPMFYAQSWAAVNWLMSTDPDAFFPFLNDLESGVSIETALRARYDKSFAQMEAGIRASNTRNSVQLRGEPRAPAAPQLADRATVLYELGRFLKHVAGAEGDAQRHFAEALRVDPRHAKALAATGKFDEAIAAGLDDAEVHLAYAETLLTTALGPFAGVFEPTPDDVPKFRKARTLAERALALGADEGAARAAMGTTYLVESSTPASLAPGIAQLGRAHALLPRRDDVALNLYAMLLRSEARDEAAALYTRVLANAADKQVAFAARNVRLVSEATRANELTRQGKLDEAAKIVRELAASTPDARGRLELEQQAASLETTAAVNRHIEMYNEAITLSNAGKNRQAVQLLDELLRVATDTVVIADAKKLRAEVRKR